MAVNISGAIHGVVGGPNEVKANPNNPTTRHGATGQESDFL